MKLKKWKRLMKQGLAVSLALALCMSTWQITAFANEDESGDTEIEEQVTVLDEQNSEESALDEQNPEEEVLDEQNPEESVLDEENSEESALDEKNLGEPTSDGDEDVITEEATCLETGEHQDEDKDDICDICKTCLADADSEAVQAFLAAVETLKNWKAKEDATDEEMEAMFVDYRASYESAKALYDALTDGQKMLVVVKAAYNNLTNIGDQIPAPMAVDDDCANGTCEHVAAIGGTHYDTLQEAVDAAESGDIVILLNETSIANDVNGLKIRSGCDITLDLNDNTIYGAIWNYGTLTITGNGTVSNTKNDNSWPAVENRGVLTVENGTYIAKSENYVLGNYNSDSNVIIKDGTFQGVINYGGMTIKGGTFNARSETASISGLVNWTGKVIIEDGTFESAFNCSIQPIHNYGGPMIIKGGTVTALRKGVPAVGMQDGPEGCTATLTITGGSFSANINGYDTGGERVGIILCDRSKSDPQITGGKFTSSDDQKYDISKFLDEEYYKQEDDGTVVFSDMTKAVAETNGTYYTTLQAAIDVAKKANGDTVTLLKDVEVDTWNQIWNVKDVTIDGGNHTLTVEKIGSGGNGDYLLSPAGEVNVKDLNIVIKKGGGAFNMKSGTLTNVTVTGGTYAVLPGNGGVNISGCTFNNQEKIAIYTDDDNGAPGLVVDHCTFNNTRIAILRDNEKVTNCTATGDIDFFQLTIVSTDTVVTGNTFSAPLELYAQPSEIKKNNFSSLGNYNNGKMFVDSSVTVDLSENYWGGDAPEAAEGITVTSYYADAEMTKLIIIGSDDNTSDDNTPGDNTTGGNTTGGSTTGGSTTGGSTTGGGTSGGSTSGGGTSAPAGATPVTAVPAPAVTTPAAAAPTVTTPAAAAPAVTTPAAAPAEEDAPAVAEILDDEDVPLAEGGEIEEAETKPETGLVELEDEETPLAAGSGSNWGLFGAILIAALAAFFIIILIRRRKEEEEEA